MVRVELPESRLRLRKRRRRLRVAALLATLVLVLGGALAGIAYIPAVQVKGVLVLGAQTLSSSTVAAFAAEQLRGTHWYVFPKSNIFLYPKQTIAEGIMSAYPMLSSADVHAVDFQTIAVNVVERAPRALWCDENLCYFMDENGVAYAEAPAFSEPVYLSYTGALFGSALPKQFLTPPEFQALSALVDAIAQKLQGEPVRAIAVDGERDVRISFASGFTLIFTLDEHGGDVFERLVLAMGAEPLAARHLADFEYLDLRFGDKLYYKLR